MDTISFFFSISVYFIVFFSFRVYVQDILRKINGEMDRHGKRLDGLKEQQQQ